jgi:cytochrome c
MYRSLQRATTKASLAAVIGGAIIALASPSLAHGGDEHAEKGHGKAGAARAKKASTHKPADVRLVMPKMDSAKGMRLFASKGCVACHSVNGVGGHDAAALDAHTMKKVMNPFEFSAKMWRGAPAMIAAQEEAMEGQILFTGQELAHIIAFVHDDAQQQKFTEAMIPANIRKKMHHTHGPKPGHQKEIGHGRKGMMHK